MEKLLKLVKLKQLLRSQKHLTLVKCSSQQIAEKYGVSPHCISDRLDTYKIKKRTYSEACSFRHKFSHKDEIIEYYKCHSWRDTVEYFNLSSRQFWYFLKENHVPPTFFYQHNSFPNSHFSKMLDENEIHYEREYILENKRFDFKVGNNLIELNPSATHNTTWSPFGDHTSKITTTYHLDKTIVAKNHNFRCIHVFDWDNENAVISLLKESKAIGARKCTLREVDKEEASIFINKHHVQYNAKFTIAIGLFHKNSLVSIMTFDQPRYNKKYEWELIRYCSSKIVVGGAEKLFNYFVKTYSPQSVISYCDLSKFSGEVYTRLKFTQLRISKPCCHWYNLKTKQHITDNLLRQRGFDQLFGTNFGNNSSNGLLMLDAGFVQVFDCGQATYIWNSKEPSKDLVQNSDDTNNSNN